MSESESRPSHFVLAGMIAVGVAVIVATGIIAMPRRTPSFHGTTFTDTAAAPPFSLVDHDGKPATLASFRGTPVLVFFGYTHCPDICPLTLSKLATALATLGDEGRDVRIALITVDPERDTPETLKAYVARFSPQALGLTGDSASIHRAMAGYGAYTLPPSEAPSAMNHGGHEGHGDSAAPATPSPGQRVIHSGAVYGIDRAGRLQVVISEAATPQEIADDVRTLARM